MDAPRWSNQREARAWRGYTSMRMQLRARSARSLDRHSGLSEADDDVLVQLSEAESYRRPFQPCDELQWEKSRVSHQLTPDDQARTGGAGRTATRVRDAGPRVRLLHTPPPARPPERCGRGAGVPPYASGILNASAAGRWFLHVSGSPPALDPPARPENLP